MVPDRAKEQARAVEWVWEEVLAWEPVGIAAVLNVGIKALIPKEAPAIP
jgi:hypothetical protein